MTEPRDLPTRIVVGANGAYWRDYTDREPRGGYSMCPVSTDNDPVDVVAVYERADGLREALAVLHADAIDTNRRLDWRYGVRHTLTVIERAIAPSSAEPAGLDVERLARATARVVGWEGPNDYHLVWAKQVAAEYEAKP